MQVHVFRVKAASNFVLPMAACAALVFGSLSIGAPGAWAANNLGQGSAAGAKGATGCGIVFSHFAFSPATVSEGGSTTLEMTVRNCRGTGFTGSVETFGKVVCVVADPVRQAVHVRAHRSAGLSMTYSVPDCTGTGTITGRLLSQAGKTLDTASASFRSVSASPTAAISAGPGQRHGGH